MIRYKMASAGVIVNHLKKKTIRKAINLFANQDYPIRF